MILLGIDPGSTKSGWCVIDTDTYKPIAFGKDDNETVMNIVRNEYYDSIAIERMASYGKAVGESVFETLIYTGRIFQIAKERWIDPIMVLRRRVKKVLLGKASGQAANDSAIRMELIKRFAKHDFTNGKGTIDNKDYFYGFHADIWQSYAIAVTVVDDMINLEE